MSVPIGAQVGVCLLQLGPVHAIQILRLKGTTMTSSIMQAKEPHPVMSESRPWFV